MPERETEWADKARQFIKADLKRRSVSYKELADRLKTQGLEENRVRYSQQAIPRNVRGDVLPRYIGCAGD